MIDPNLLDYIKKARQAGQKDEEIKAALLSNGWAVDLVEEGFRAIYGTDSYNLDARPEEKNQPVIQPAKRIGRFKASRILVKESWGLLKKDKEMLFFPILSAAVGLVFMAIMAGVFYFAVLGGNIDALKESQTSFLTEIIYIFVTYFIGYFIVIFFQTGIITIANGRMNNQDLSFSDGLSNSFKHIGKIALWSLVAASVGMILRMIAERSKILGRIVVAILGTAWNILTFFIAPIIILEDLSLKDSLKKSALIIKKTWGEAVIINVGVGLFFIVLILLGMGLFIISLFSGEAIVIIGAAILLFLYIMVLMVVSSALDIIFKLVLYHYANSGVVPSGFSSEALNLAFKIKGAK